MAQGLEAPTQAEIGLMADVLYRRYQRRAAEVAADFAEEHRVIGDTARARAWSEVATCLTARMAPTLS